MADDEEFVTVYETDRQVEVALIKMALQDADVRFVAVNDVISTVYPVDGMAVVGFQVLRRDADRARDALTRLGLKP